MLHLQKTDSKIQTHHEDIVNLGQETKEFRSESERSSCATKKAVSFVCKSAVLWSFRPVEVSTKS